MKKVITIVLAITLLTTMNLSAFADEKPETTVTLNDTVLIAVEEVVEAVQELEEEAAKPDDVLTLDDTVKPVKSDFPYLAAVKLPKSEQKYMFSICGENLEMYAMFFAVIENESQFTEKAVGYNTNGTRDWGYGQLNDCTLPYLRRTIGVTSTQDYLDGRTNMRGMRALFDYHLASVATLSDALLRYQVGEGNYASYRERGIYTTKTHQKVLARYSYYLNEVKKVAGE